MNCNISVSPQLIKELKRLSKRYKSIKEYVRALSVSLRKNPLQGTDLGKGLRKVRMSISSKGKGKSGGARVITYTVILANIASEIKLLTIYDKSECENISDKALQSLIRKYVLIEDNSYHFFIRPAFPHAEGGALFFISPTCGGCSRGKTSDSCLPPSVRQCARG